MTIFENEEQIIKKIQALLDEEQHQDNPLLPEFRELLHHYRRVYKQLQHVITLSDRQQLRLNELNRELAESNASKDKFFSIIAHDLRGPLSSLIGLSEVLQEQVRDDAPKAKLGCSSDLIYSSTKDLYALLENLLTWSQIQRGAIDYHMEQLELAEISKFALRLFQGRAQQKQLQLINDVPQGLFVEADYNMLSTILRNLLSNALKFTPVGGRISVAARNLEHDVIEVSVSDTGVGIPQKEQENLFCLDRHYSGIGTAGEKGTGLGLNLCKEFIEKAGQLIWVESEPGQGTSFKFTLFASFGSQAGETEAAPLAATKRSAEDFSEYRMLVVDDVPANRQALINFLRPFGFRFREANNGQEAFAVWQQWHPQIVWMDIRMPVMDGYVSARKMKAATTEQKTAIIALTASVPEDDYPGVLAAGYDNLLRKPFQEIEVLELIEQYLGLRPDVQEPQDTPAPQEIGLKPEDLIGLPPELLERLDYIAKVFDMSVAHKLVDDLRPRYAHLAEELSTLLSHFSFDRLQELLDQYRAL